MKLPWRESGLPKANVEAIFEISREIAIAKSTAVYPRSERELVDCRADNPAHRFSRHGRSGAHRMLHRDFSQFAASASRPTAG
jgi:hypothetical protein